MMAAYQYQIQLVEDKEVVINGLTAQSLISCGNGDAVLLYLCLVSRKADESSQLMRILQWSEAQLHEAIETLCNLGLVQRPAPFARDNTSHASPPQNSASQASSFSRGDNRYCL